VILYSLYCRANESYCFYSCFFWAGGNPGILFSNVDNLKQVRKLLSDLIHRLPDSYREAMRLRVLEDYSYNEIAAKLDLPLPTVSTKLHKGKKLLAELARRQPDLSPQLLH